MKTLLDRCLEQTDRLRGELRRGIEFIETGRRLSAPDRELQRLKAMLSELNFLVDRYVESTSLSAAR
jgi:hypothetical protein